MDVVLVVVVVLLDLEVVDGANVRKKNGYINLYILILGESLTFMN